MNSTLEEKTKKVLLYLASRQEIFCVKSQTAKWKDQELEITEYERLLARKIFKHLLSKYKKPSFRKNTLILDSKCALIERPTKARSYDLWVKISTLEKGKPVWIPINLHDYFHQREGVLTPVVQIVEEDGELKLRLVKEVHQREMQRHGVVALDFGMNSLFATDRGDLFGRSFYQKVKEYAEKIDKLQRNLQRQGIKPKESKRYRRLQERLSAFVKSEIRRLLNRIIKLYSPEVIVIENLNGFLNEVINNFPKSVKRVLIRFGLGEIRKKLRELQEEYGIRVVEVNQAYSSQACCQCGYVDRENRKDRDTFECKCCGIKLHADVNASRNLRERFLGSLHLRRMEQALRWQVERFLQNLSSERFKCLRGKARSLLTQNPYFKKVLGDSSKPEVWINNLKGDICPC
ncbi:RNA-guided endonuclease InsQ/TnpB family protein [Hydrogenobacter hydrogenophilus]|uniref:RNA-guided endonuclease InsQ/TnpB family protein n=1 Tax=Hydrogenobacter hydrogenophilus TaxID=35835 RepID=UPI00117BCB59|nr:RNA-guided endonuclease TnpB family protein [Hydrogenobacter hydrogenophilus]